MNFQTIILLAAMVLAQVHGQDSSYCLGGYTVDPTCFEQQECDSALSSLMIHEQTNILCDFKFTVENMTFNQDYPTCSESKDSVFTDLGMLLSVPVPTMENYLIQNPTLPEDILSPENNTISVPWGIGSTCNGTLALFYKGLYDESYLIAKTVPIESLADGETISAKATLWGFGSAIHRRRTHEGCAIGGFTTFMLEATCRLGEATSVIGDAVSTTVSSNGQAAVGVFASSSFSPFSVAKMGLLTMASLAFLV